jgi:hypothetical protein
MTFTDGLSRSVEKCFDSMVNKVGAHDFHFVPPLHCSLIPSLWSARRRRINSSAVPLVIPPARTALLYAAIVKSMRRISIPYRKSMSAVRCYENMVDRFNRINRSFAFGPVIPIHLFDAFGKKFQDCRRCLRAGIDMLNMIKICIVFTGDFINFGKHIPPELVHRDDDK